MVCKQLLTLFLLNIWFWRFQNWKNNFPLYLKKYENYKIYEKLILFIFSLSCQNILITRLRVLMNIDIIIIKLLNPIINSFRTRSYEHFFDNKVRFRIIKCSKIVRLFITSKFCKFVKITWFFQTLFISATHSL